MAEISHHRYYTFASVFAPILVLLHVQMCTAPHSHALEQCEHHCSEHGSCVKVHASVYECHCHHGWHGTDCSKQNIQTTSTTHAPHTQKPSIIQSHYHQKACNYHGHVLSSGTCHCHDGWTGNKCQYAPGTHSDNNCHNQCGDHGNCVEHQNTHGSYYSCRCNSGWHGVHCTLEYAQTGTVSCHNTYCVHGVCAYESYGLYHFNYHCTCNDGWQGLHCDNKITTVKTTHTTTTTTTTTIAPQTTKLKTRAPSSSTTTTTTTSVTTPMTMTKQTQSYSTSSILTTKSSPISVSPPTIYHCNHVDTIVAVAYQTPVSNKNAIECSPQQHTSHEAFVLTECEVPRTPASWKQGFHVMTSCIGSNPIPDLTPIASFDNGIYSSVGSLSGVFLGCTSDGFKVAFQACGQSPKITELLLGEHFNQNPNNFYTIS